MCLMLYIATEVALPEREGALSIEPLSPTAQAVREWLSLPRVSFIGVYGGCSCDFPHVMAEQPIEYYEGMFEEEEKEKNSLINTSLFTLLRAALADSPGLELYPVQDGDEGISPKGTIAAKLSQLRPDEFFFTERFLYQIVA